MVLQQICITRHGFRANWANQESRPLAFDAEPPDVSLSAHGLHQADELCRHLAQRDPPVDRIISSPFFRCIETIAPLAAEKKLTISLEPGIGEWYGLNRVGQQDSVPSSAELLKGFFPNVDAKYIPVEEPDAAGESIQGLYDRCARVLGSIICSMDTDPSQPATLLLCSHAATSVMLCRALSGGIPSDVTRADYIPWTAGLTVFRRTDDKSSGVPGSSPSENAQHVTSPSWECEVRGDCSFLSNGPERGWRFSGKESFSAQVAKKGVDAGTGLGVVVEAPPF